MISIFIDRKLHLIDKVGYARFNFKSVQMKRVFIPLATAFVFSQLEIVIWCSTFVTLLNRCLQNVTKPPFCISLGGTRGIRSCITKICEISSSWSRVQLQLQLHLPDEKADRQTGKRKTDCKASKEER